jgi:hypothetical protein
MDFWIPDSLFWVRWFWVMGDRFACRGVRGVACSAARRAPACIAIFAASSSTAASCVTRSDGQHVGKLTQERSFEFKIMHSTDCPSFKCSHDFLLLPIV